MALNFEQRTETLIYKIITTVPGRVGLHAQHSHEVRWYEECPGGGD